eukprot:TRINITY_DN2265_c0_g2_i1.p1 TRINITY_DN2265_c0_g2~~TRINITY_DN2265_c0_g2_i1.p1  ORF type:complete len:969 (+),score=239.95 TRINITY_DN2265_c0_g2_i1:402-2909(+)
MRWGLVRRVAGGHFALQLPTGKIIYLMRYKSSILFISSWKYQIPPDVKKTLDEATKAQIEKKKQSEENLLRMINERKVSEGKEAWNEIPTDEVLSLEPIVPILDYKLFDSCNGITLAAKSETRNFVTRDKMQSLWAKYEHSGEDLSLETVSDFLFGNVTYIKNETKILASSRAMAEYNDLFEVKPKEQGMTHFACRSKRYVEWRRGLSAALNDYAGTEDFLDAVFDHLLQKATLRTTFLSFIPDSFGGKVREMMELQNIKKWNPVITEVEKKFDLEKFRKYIDILKLALITPSFGVLDRRIHTLLTKGMCVMNSSSSIHNLLYDLDALDDETDVNLFNIWMETPNLDPYPQDMLDSLTDQLPFVSKENGGLPDVYRKQREEKLGDRKETPTPLPYSIQLVDSNGRKTDFGENIFTVDSDDTIEVDDAVSVTRDGWVHVHIADPTRFIPKNSDLDLYARSRGTSMYNVGSWVSMLPPSIAAGPMSISAKHETNPCLTFSAKISENGEILDSKIQLSSISNIKRSNYEQADEALNQESFYSEFFRKEQVKDLKELYQWSQKRNEYRKRNGMSNLSLPKMNFEIKDGTRTPKHEKHLKSSYLIQEMMILAGEVAAINATKHKFDLPYRVQATPSSILPDSFTQESVDPGHPYYELIESIRKIHTMQPAYNSVEKLGHYSIGVPDYVRVTSPIRRYMDIVSHYQIKSHLFDIGTPFKREELSPLIRNINNIESKVKKSQQQSLRFHLERYLSTELHNVYDAVFLGRQANMQSNIFIPSICLIAKVNDAPVHKVGDVLKVRSIKSYHSTIQFECVTTRTEFHRDMLPSGDLIVEDTSSEY